MDTMQAPPNVLIVDDEPIVRFALCRALQGEKYRIHEAADGEEALRMVQAINPDIVFLDIMIPKVNGLDVVKRVKESCRTKGIPVVIVSVLSNQEDKFRALEAGAEGYIAKPPHPVEVRLAARSLIRLKRFYHGIEESKKRLEKTCFTLKKAVEVEKDEIVRTQTSALVALARLAECRDAQIGRHIERIQHYCLALLNGLKKMEKYAEYITPRYEERLFLSSTIHDIGKVGIPDNILLKPGKLDESEFEIMKRHTVIGGDTLKLSEEIIRKKFTYLTMARHIAYSHHEKFDGSGYPNGTKGEEIPLSARIVAVADVYDAMTSKRCYKDAFSHETAKKFILDQAGKHFDDEVVEAFLVVEAEFIGIMERMNS